MRIIDNKVLLVETREPAAIIGSIKKSALMERRKDLSKVAVHWGLKEAQEQTALGMDDVPSPILRDYTWTGRLTPFAHQKTTSSFFRSPCHAAFMIESGHSTSTRFTSPFFMR